MKYLLIAFAVLLMGAHCESPEPVPPDPVPPEPTEPPKPPSVASCATACENQRHLECDLGDPTPEGSTCEEVCEVSFNAGVPGLEWDVSKLTAATRCSE